MITAYCVKCKKKDVGMDTPTMHRTKRGGYMAKGSCPSCSTTLCAIMSKDNAEKAIASGVKTAE